MPLNLSTTQQYLVAIALPLGLASLTWFLHGLISPANIALFYILAVIVIAVNTATRPALVAALASFLAFNFSYTEPRGSFFVMHRQDLLMIIIFLLVALLVGQLAANLKEQLERLRSREFMAGLELKFLQKLSAAFSVTDILEVLRISLASVPGLQYQLLPCTDGKINWSDKTHIEQAKVRQQITEYLAGGKAHSHSELQCENFTLYFLGDGQAIRGVLVIYPNPASTRNIARLMAQQAILALTRTRLGAELDAERSAREIALMRSALLSSLSHDFKTPLTSMIGASTTLLELGNELNSEQRKELLQSILSESHRLNNFTQKLLDLSQLGEGEFSLHRTTIAIEEIIHAVLKRIRQTWAHDIALDIPSNLPLIEVHAALIEQALYNVLDNACKFTEPDQPIRLCCSVQQDQLQINVEDSGPGIPDSEKEHVFEMFHSANRGDRRVAGSGLGLAISKGMIGAHGGTITIADSTSLGGCLVKIRLPTSTETDS